MGGLWHSFRFSARCTFLQVLSLGFPFVSVGAIGNPCDNFSRWDLLSSFEVAKIPILWFAHNLSFECPTRVSQLKCPTRFLHSDVIAFPMPWPNWGRLLYIALLERDCLFICGFSHLHLLIFKFFHGTPLSRYGNGLQSLEWNFHFIWVLMNIFDFGGFSIDSKSANLLIYL